jgi:putative membrane protein
MDTQITPDKKATEYLANERTYLAWIRTSISIMSLGFVVAKFSVWMRELVVRLDPGTPVLTRTITSIITAIKLSKR